MPASAKSPGGLSSDDGCRRIKSKKLPLPGEQAPQGVVVSLPLHGSLHGKLAVIQIRVETALCQQGLMVALFDDVSVFHYQDDISALDGGKSVGYDEAGAAFHHFGECVLDLDLGTGIDGGGGLIEDQHGRQAQHHSGNT